MFLRLKFYKGRWKMCVKISVSLAALLLVFVGAAIGQDVESDEIYSPLLEYEVSFSGTVGADGSIVEEKEVRPPLSGRILEYKIEIEPESGCSSSLHSTLLYICRKDDPSDDFELQSEIPECKEVGGPVDYKLKRGRTYLIKLQSSGFIPGDEVKGTAKVVYRLGSFSKGALAWERQTAAEAALIREMKANLQGRKTERDKEPGKERCKLTGSKQKHGLREHRYTEITPDYESLEIWVDWRAGQAYGVMDIEVYGYANQKDYDKCLGQLYSYTAALKGVISLRIDIDVSSGNADVKIHATFRETEYWGAPQWSSARSVINSLIKTHGERIVNDKLRGYEHIIEDKINGSRGSQVAIRAESALEFISPESLRVHPDAFEVLKLEWLLSSTPKPFNLLHFSELNPEYLAARANNQTFVTQVPHIDVDTQFGIWIRDLTLTMKTEDTNGRGSIQPGDIRLTVAPLISAEFDKATLYFNFVSKTNLFSGGEGPLEGNGRVEFTFAHTYEEPKIDFEDFQIVELSSPQLNDGLTRLIRRRLNEELPKKIKEDDALLRAIAEVLNDAIGDVIGRVRTRPFLDRDQFLDQLGVTAATE